MTTVLTNAAPFCAASVVCVGAAACSLQDLDSLGAGGASSAGLPSTGGVVLRGNSGASNAGSGGNGGTSAGSAGTAQGMGGAEWISLTVVDAGVDGLLRDPSFEQGTDEWQAVGSAILQRSSDRPRSGDYCLGVTRRAAEWTGPGFDMTDLVSSGETYSVSLWARNLDQVYQHNATVRYTCSGGTLEYARVTSGQVGFDWTELAASFTVPECETLLEITLFVENEAEQGYGDFQLDDVYILPL